MESKQITDETVETFHWIFSELWTIFVLAKLGHYDEIDEKLEKVLLFLKSSGINEVAMSLEEDLDKESLVNLINQFIK